MKRIPERIAEAREALGINQSELARRLAVTPQAVQSWEAGKAIPRPQRLVQIAEALGISASALLDGLSDDAIESAPTGAAGKVLALLQKHGKQLSAEQQDRLEQAVSETLAGVASTVVDVDFSGRKSEPGEIRIPQYDIRGSMGHGQLPADYAETIRNVTIDEAHLREKGVSYTSASALAMITGWGQSMAGTINDKDPLIVDRGVREFTEDGVYVLTWHGLLYIKRLQVADADHFELISDNPKHKDRTVPMDEVTIHAKVLLVWNAQKL